MIALADLAALDDILRLDVPGPDAAAAEAARARQAQLTKPPGSLGRLEALAAFMAAMSVSVHTALLSMLPLMTGITAFFSILLRVCLCTQKKRE